MVESYQALYCQQIEKAQTKDGQLAGLLLMQGPTGLGKTSALEKDHTASPSVLRYMEKRALQGIFVTHRWNILGELAANLEQAGIRYSVIYSRQEQIVAAITAAPLPHNTQSDVFPAWQEALHTFSADNLWVLSNTSLDDIKRCASDIEQYARQLKEITDKRLYSLLDDINRKLASRCQFFESAIIENLKRLTKKAKQSGYQTRKRRTGQGHSHTATKAEQFRANAFVRRVLPAIAWKDDVQPLLIMTTHKLYHGFFDGERKVKMGESHLKNKVIFIDEFEYQEPELLNLLSQQQKLQELPQCLGVLTGEGKRLIARLRVAHPDDERLNHVFDELDNIFDDAIKTLEEKGISFSTHRALVRNIDEPFNQSYLFSSSYFISSKLTRLLPVDHGLQIVRAYEKGTVSANFYFSTLEKALRKTLFTLSHLVTDQQYETGAAYLDEFLHLIFNSVNDYRPGHYQKSLNTPAFVSAVPNTNLREFTELLKSDQIPYSRSHIYGLSCWLLKQATEASDNLRIVQRRVHLPTTPEALIVAMASRNLVFGLSATAMINRCYGNFDINWMNSALTELAEQRRKMNSALPVPLLHTNDFQQKMETLVSGLKEKKAAVRAGKVTVQTENLTLHNPETTEYDNYLDALWPDFFQSRDDDPEETISYRKKTLVAGLNIIKLVTENQHHKGQLAYVNSSRYIRKWLHDENAADSRSLCQWLSVIEPEKYVVQGIPEEYKDSKDFVFCQVGEQCIAICLLTAQTQKLNNFHKLYQGLFDIADNVLVLTQNASATNGINLDFLVKQDGGKATKSDLTCLYLFEAKHFFFSLAENAETDEEQMALIGAQIRTLQKLRQSSELSESDYRHYIGALMSQKERVVKHLNNTIYPNTFDYVMNVVADVQQQVGRLERVWLPTEEIKIVIQHELAEVLKRYASEPHGFGKHKAMMSSVNQALFEQIAEHTDTEGFFIRLMAAPQPETEAVQFIDDELVPAIRASRQPDYTQDTASLHQVWEQLGNAFLCRDLSAIIDFEKAGLTGIQGITLKEWACAKVPVAADLREGIYITSDSRYLSKWQPETRSYSLKPFYRWVNHHEAISEWFVRHGYPTSAHISGGMHEQYIFYPGLAQRIFQGRIGEEAIRGLLDARGHKTTTQLLSPKTLEAYDFHVLDTHYFVDAKLWSVKSQREADDNYRRYLESRNDYLQPFSAADKLHHIREHIDPKAVLVIANLVGEAGDETLRGFDLSFNPVALQDADILIVPGCIDPASENTYAPAFNGLCAMLDTTKIVSQ